MACVDPHLTSACDVSIDVDPTLLTLLDRVQKLFLRRLLGVTKRSPVAPLFSETGMWPIRYRRIMLALQYWQYALSLPNDHFLSCAFRDSLALAQDRRSSWLTDLARALSAFHVPVHLDLFKSWSPADVDGVVTAVEESCLKDIETYLSTSPKTPLLRRTSNVSGNVGVHARPLEKQAICAFRAYLRVPIPAHRKAVVRLLSSSHTLAVEVLRWTDRRQPAVPRAQRWCRFCHSNIEDEVHALWLCDASQAVRDLRTCFSRDIVSLAPVDFLQHLRSAPTAYHVVRLLSDTEHDVVVCRFAKYVHDILKVFGEIPVLRW
ncbi:hypothetical protein EDD18DRAFT_1198835 [Armillaria luteobubalina]|uniref:Uncharacterized protein n=1 Tax=Armillaria luteobubalina TaxID=153913 RepID=A0AA39TEL4_9AGAR|nr:hypothetical protein EDD18DRAFT_1198835 [Armillaria luteobubalina]